MEMKNGLQVNYKNMLHIIMLKALYCVHINMAGYLNYCVRHDLEFSTYQFKFCRNTRLKEQ